MTAVFSSLPHELKKLTVSGFRNISQLSLEPGSRFNIIFGDNGEGKTSILEAIHYLTSLRSFRSAKTDDLINHTAQSAIVVGNFDDGKELIDTCGVGLDRSSSRKVQVNGKKVRSRSEHYMRFQSVIFHAEHLRLVSGAPEVRRNFFDEMIEKIDPSYAEALSRYQKAVRQRNRLLKDYSKHIKAIRAYDPILVEDGLKVMKTRSQVLSVFEHRVRDNFHSIFGEELSSTIRYQPKVEVDEKSFHEALEKSFPKDCARGFTGSGPHGDDMVIEIEGKVARHVASQGQQRTIALALKIAELLFLAEKNERVPLLLLDDVSSELDRQRNRRLFTWLSQLGGQVFLTTTHPEFILLETDRRDFSVKNGTITS